MAKSKPVFADLADAILALVESAHWSPTGQFYTVEKQALTNLWNQYKIYFIEPENDTEFTEWQNEND